jgi:uncharacterized RDD family membrane protein YckC
MEPIGVWKRAVAVIIDGILLGIVGYAIAGVTGGATGTGFNLSGAPFFLWLLISLGYYILMEGTKGATLGKMAMKLKVVKVDGGAIDWQAAIVRNVVRLVDGLFFYLVGAIAVWVSKKKQRLGDMAASTIVVSSRVAMLLAALIFAGAIPDDARAASPRYSDIVLSDTKDGPAKALFKPDTPKLYLRAKLVDMPAGTKLRGEWIAEKTRVAPPNYRIDASDLNVGSLMNQAQYSLSKPNAGWPEGDYRVDLFIDGKPATQVKFKVGK